MGGVMVMLYYKLFGSLPLVIFQVYALAIGRFVGVKFNIEVKVKVKGINKGAFSTEIKSETIKNNFFNIPSYL